MLRHGPRAKNVSRLVLATVSILSLLGSLRTSNALVYYSLVKESQVIISSPPVILQNGTAGTSTIYTNNTSVKVSVAASSWLGGWDKRVKITVDSNDADAALSTFPVLVYLSNSSGRNDADVSFIFDELQNNTNRKKIAITTSDGVSQCYVEIERWDDPNEQAWLWVKVPSISNTTDTDLYLYYDKDHVDNTAYVGDSGSTTAQNVWNSSFKGVWHLGEISGGTGAIQDSTSNSNDGTDNGSPTFGATGRIDSAISFDGVNDYINITNSASLQFTSSLTIEAWINLESFGSGTDVDIVLRKGEGNPNDWQLAIHDQKLGLRIEENDGAGLDGSTNLTATTWYYLTGTWNGSIRRVYLNGSEDGSGSKTGSIIPDTRDIYIGGRLGTDLSTGVIDEVRVSNTTRGAAWIKASCESGRDDLLGFGVEKIRNFWSAEYNYRKQLTITNNIASTLGSSYTVLLTLDTASLVTSGKMLSSGNDLRIVNWNGSSFVEIDREIIGMNTNSTQIWFRTQAGIGPSATDTNYYMYYGNPSAQNPPEGRSNVYLWFDDFSTNTTNNYDVDRHADDWHGASTNIYKPYWDSANNAVYFDTGDNYAGDWMPNAINETDVYAEMKMNITGSYSTNTTNGILLRWQNSSTFYGGHISGDSYLSPCIIKNGRTTYVANKTPSEYHAWNQWFTFAVAVYGSDLKLWVDGVQKVNGTDTQITTSGKISFVVGQSIGWMDDFKIRKYVEPEPTLTSDGEERISYNYVLRVNNTVTDSWEIRLKKYSDTSIGRLHNCTIYFHNSTDGSSTQIYIENGLFNQTEGSWYNLDSLETIYIAMTVEANSTGTSYVYTYLEVRTPGTTTYLQYRIVFEIT